MQDQIFQPGDKVMRICKAGQLPNMFWPLIPFPPEAGFGKVLCVSKCYPVIIDSYHRVRFVGIDDKSGWGFFAACFRKVEEIKLCIEAVAKTNVSKVGVEQKIQG